jgi:hypothetical protein
MAVQTASPKTPVVESVRVPPERPVKLPSSSCQSAPKLSTVFSSASVVARYCRPVVVPSKLEA